MFEVVHLLTPHWLKHCHISLLGVDLVGVDLEGVDLVGSWSGGSWSCGSWFHGSWSRKYESTNGHRNHSSPLLWSRHHFCYCKNFSGRKSIHWLKHPDHLKLANEWVWSRWSPRSECVKRKLWFKFPGLSLERCPCRNAVKGLVSSAFWSFFVL